MLIRLVIKQLRILAVNVGCLLEDIAGVAVCLSSIDIGPVVGARCSSVLRALARGSLDGLNPLSYFSFQPVLHDWCNKGCSMCYRVCGIVHVKEPLLLIRKSSPCGGSEFPLSEWSDAI